MSMIDKARIAAMGVLQRGNIPPGTNIDSEAIVRAVIGVMRCPTKEMIDAPGGYLEALLQGPSGDAESVSRLNLVAPAGVIRRQPFAYNVVRNWRS